MRHGGEPGFGARPVLLLAGSAGSGSAVWTGVLGRRRWPDESAAVDLVVCAVAVLLGWMVHSRGGAWPACCWWPGQEIRPGSAGGDDGRLELLLTNGERRERVRGC